ncbi:uncharacterized protein LOC121871933 [Homarus americanus]|uniref:Uncharacterized protein n=1 Tax=Homarus americanus TaxID=6706 RepID=A0A8J5JY65_HOMAM|nr:uncharacterized protein LOC121871933 [Homarus americanus]KAG7164238.1 hypothetical protein Hamer_G020750 [Homarus americanus]
MKYLVIFLATLSLAWGQEIHCHCVTAVTVEDGAELIHGLPFTEVVDCSNFEECELRCSEEFTELTNGGDLDFVLDNGKVVGQVACDNLAKEGYQDLEPSEVYMYSSICHGPWLYNGFKSQQKLCCEGGQYTPC